MEIGQHDKLGISPRAEKTFQTLNVTLLDRIPWRMSHLVILLWLFSATSSCYAGPHAQAVSSSGTSTSIPDTLTSQKIHHFVQLAVEESFSTYLLEIQKTLQAIEHRLASTPLHNLPAQQPCLVNVNCPADAADPDHDSGLRKLLQNIEGKIEKLNLPSTDGSHDPCRLQRSNLQTSSDEFLIGSAESITECVGLLIQQVAILDRLTMQFVSVKSTSAIDQPDVKTFVADNLIRRIEELNKQATHIKETLNKNQPSHFSEPQLLMGSLGLILLSVVTWWLIRYFMKQVYGNDNDNPFNAFALSLASCSDELSEDARHYSKLRFAIFTIFAAIFGALGTMYFSKDYQDTTKPLHNILPPIGIVVTIVFASLEFAIDWIEVEYCQMARAIRLHWTPASRVPINVRGAIYPMTWVRVPIWAIFYLSVFVWSFVPGFVPGDDQLEAPLLIGRVLAFIAVLGFWCFLCTGGGLISARLNDELRGRFSR